MKITLLETAGWYTVFKNLRQSYSLDSRSDLCIYEDSFECNLDNDEYGHYRMVRSEQLEINHKDLQLLSTLVKKGDSHSKIIRGIQTYVEITAPRYWWQEWITYCIGILELNPTIDWVALNSESTMHTLLKEDIKKGLFSKNLCLHVYQTFKDWIDYVKNTYSDKTEQLREVKGNLPESYLQTRTYMVSYQAWRRIYQQRQNHKLEEWNTDIVNFIEGLPFSKELILIENGNN